MFSSKTEAQADLISHKSCCLLIEHWNSRPRYLKSQHKHFFIFHLTETGTASISYFLLS